MILLTYMAQQTRTYSLVVDFHRDEEGYLAHFPALPGCHTWAEDYEDAVARAEEALVGYLEALAKAGKKIPVDNRPVRGVSLGITLEVPVTA